MLTGLDFPLELFYGPGCMWVRDDRAGAVRLGLHFYAVPRRGPVVHVQLPPAGTELVKGEEFGHIDMGSATFPLVSPVSGTVFVPNPDLRQDADLVRQDAFGAGYLVDVEGVDSIDFDDLLDPDEAMAHYSRFEAESKPHASMVVEPDRPWFTSLTFGFGDTVLARARILPPLSNETFVPDWEVGASWAVRSFVEGEERLFDFAYEGEDRLAGEAVFRVRARERRAEGAPEEGRAPPERVLFLRQASFTLVAYDLVPAESPTLFRRCWNERGDAAHMHLGAEDGFFYDHPFIPPGRLDFTRDLPETASLPALIDHYRFRGGGTRCEVEMRASIRNDVGVEERWFSQQIWIAGQPWWTQAVRMRGDRVLMKANLVTDEG